MNNFNIQDAVAYMKDYINTYEQQYGWKQYTKQTFTDDMLYGLGVSIGGEKYKWGNGYDAFKKHLCIDPKAEEGLQRCINERNAAWFKIEQYEDIFRENKLTIEV